MKRTAILTALSAALALPAAADGISPANPDPVVVSPEPVAAPAPRVVDWSGFYAGLGAATGSGEIVYDPGATYDVQDEAIYSGFIGYNAQRGNLVFGGELNVLSGLPGAVGFPDEQVGTTFEVRARAGYAAGRAMPYLFVGYAQGDYEDIIASDQTLSGITYGAGVDFMVTDRIFAGLEVTRRNLDGDTTSPGQTRDYESTTIGLRVGFRF